LHYLLRRQKGKPGRTTMPYCGREGGWPPNPLRRGEAETPLRRNQSVNVGSSRTLKSFRKGGKRGKKSRMIIGGEHKWIKETNA